MPLVWAHAEYVKLRRSLHDGHGFDTPPQTVQRYVVEKTGSPYALWRYNQKSQRFPAGKTLRVETLAPALVHWSADGWASAQDVPARDTGLGTFVADLPTGSLPAGSNVVFTLYWPEQERWEGADYTLAVNRPAD
jgi:glucoamylase